MKLFFAVFATIAMVASPVKADNFVKDHQTLAEAIEAVGVPVIINSEWCATKPGIAGAYRWNSVIGLSEMYICQDNGRAGGPQVDWTDNDFDTLRHEAHHLVQDCLDGKRADDRVSSVLKGPHLEAIKHVLPPKKFNRIIEVYRQHGAKEEDLFAELEAFAIAKAMSASDIAKHVIKACAI